MLAPILPSPIMPSCIVSLLSGAVWGVKKILPMRLRQECAAVAVVLQCCIAAGFSTSRDEFRFRCLLQRLLNRRIQRLQILRDVFAEMDAKRPAAAFGQHGEITASLRCFHDAEGVFLVRYFDIDGVIARDLEEDTRVGPAFVCLTR